MVEVLGMMKTIWTRYKNKPILIGKHIDNNIIRELPFNKAILWKLNSFSLPQKLVDYAERNAVENFIFADLLKQQYVKISMQSVLEKSTKDDYGFGPHVYVPVDEGVELESYVKAPYTDKETENVTLT